MQGRCQSLGDADAGITAGRVEHRAAFSGGLATGSPRWGVIDKRFGVRQFRSDDYPVRAVSDGSPSQPFATSPKHSIVLVPGFFGFSTFGELAYFNGVREALVAEFSRRGFELSVEYVTTLPTASIRVRAARVLDTLARVAAESECPIHVIGHSTGGLDARLAIAPTASLPTHAGKHFDYGRVRTLISVCAPHFGTPLATFFSSALGKPLLKTFARYWAWALERGRVPVNLMLRLGYFIVRLRDPFRKRRSTFDELYEKLLNDFRQERRLELIQFLRAVSSDQSLMFQLTPAGCDLLNACTGDPEVRYGSVVARGKKPSLRTLVRSAWDLYSQIMHPIYALFHFIAARGDSSLVPPPVPSQSQRLLARYGELPSARDNDGIVPTNSQLWGELIYATTADHLDVVGQFGRIDAESWSGDWLPSYSGFDTSEFNALWAAVTDFILRDANVSAPAREAVGVERTEQDMLTNS
jgi:triacylglycerol esterase/lipase EstA (alpha/beta hydrolase family)